MVAPGGVLGRSGPLELPGKVLVAPGGLDMALAARRREVPSWELDLGRRKEDKRTPAEQQAK